MLFHILKGRLVGLDISKKRVGIAISDNRWHIATPLTFMERKKKEVFLKALKDTLSPYPLAGFVVGLPYHMDGRFGARAQSCRDIGLMIATYFNLDIAWVDERLSTVQAHEIIGYHHGKKKNHRYHDAVAASVILQTYLDTMHKSPTSLS